MAVIGKIREKSTLLLIMIGGAMLAFVLGDAFSSRMSVFGNERENLGEIDGVEISGAEFESKVQEQIAEYKEREQASNVPESVASQIREQVWNNMLRERIMGSELEELGVKVSSKELADITYGSNPHPQVKQAFTNPETGVFNSADVIRFIKNLDQDETGQTKKQWLSFEEAIKDQRQINKYNTLISKGLYVTQAEAREQFEETNLKMDIRYVFKPYAAIPDSAVEVSESEAKNYYEEHQNEFKQDRIRTVTFASFDIVPSPEDTAATREWVNETYERFRKTEDDSLFVTVNSDKAFDRMLYSRGLLPENIDTTVLDQDSAGFIIPPVLREDGTYQIVKIAQVKHAPDSVNARHIVISFQRMEEDSAMSLADSIKGALEGGADFAALARQYSDDPSSKEDTGNLGWFRENMMLKAINDATFDAKVGEYFVVKSQVGAHVFQVLEKSPVVKKVQLAVIERKLEPSRETYDDYFIKANQFSIAVEGGKDINELAKQEGVNVQVAQLKENDNSMAGMPGSRQIIRWAYKSDEGTISEPFNTENRFIVAALTEVKEEGVAPFEKVKEQARAGAIREKKAEKMKEQLQGEDLAAIAQKAGLQVQTANGLNYAAFSLPKIGFEPEVQGKIFSLSQGDMSRPIEGRNGVYVVAVESVTEVPQEADLTVNKMQLQSGLQSRVNYQVFEALKEHAKVKDNRYLFY